MYRSVVFILSFVGLLCLGRSQQPCAPGQSNYTISKYSTEYEVVNHTYETLRRYVPNCNTWEEIKSWFRTENKCDTKCVLEKVTRTINQTKSVKHEITQCCPGYKNETGICIEDCGPGKFGEHCEQNCSCSIPNFYCDSNGHCLCPAGLTGDNCSLVCKDGTFGMNCSNKCMCNNNSTCDIINGSCNCTNPGWEGEMCDKECHDGTFGYKCKQICICNANQTCSHVDGLCTCKAGWRGINCSKECEDHKFGVDCKEDCSCNRNNTESCDRKTGYCLCRPGYIDMNCTQECPFGLYGEGCNYNCSNHCTGTDYCDFRTGSCICLGKWGTSCSEECEHVKYGPNCEWECNCNYTNSNGSCDAYTGSCHCAAGWEGRNCTTDAAIRAQVSPDQKNSLTYGLAGAGVLLATLIIVVVVVVYRRNKRKSQREDNITSGNDGSHGYESLRVANTNIEENSYEVVSFDAQQTDNETSIQNNLEKVEKTDRSYVNMHFESF